jgi:hypothetical protein
MPKFNLKPAREKLQTEEKILTPEKLALDFISVGLARDLQIMTDEIILSRLGLKKERVTNITLDSCRIEINRMIKKIVEVLKKEYELYRE